MPAAIRPTGPVVSPLPVPRPVAPPLGPGPSPLLAAPGASDQEKVGVVLSMFMALMSVLALHLTLILHFRRLLSCKFCS